ncbi:uncharacterized protein LOC111409587 [Olea europaea var. sylvestris]|uniref:uncharacterized protein LOC111409587 n=1 Tax=Olea europaea var. sylvestris TaxID=158386 RepID=UPI000C1D41DC|nr:uncharacterized protein LOC111409587 [Olea europaea var. sylvestris]
MNTGTALIGVQVIRREKNQNINIREIIESTANISFIKYLFLSFYGVVSMRNAKGFEDWERFSVEFSFPLESYLLNLLLCQNNNMGYCFLKAMPSESISLFGVPQTSSPTGVFSKDISVSRVFDGSDGGRPSGAGIFIGGFVLGGLVVGTLSCVCAPQISKALAGADKKDLMKKLPKFIYDEEKVLEKQRQKLAEKIEQLNSAIDNVSTQLRSDDPPNGEAVNSDEVESVV